MEHKAVARFISRIIVGLLIAVFLGSYLDDCLNTRPIIMIALIIYVIGGSLILLVKEAGGNNGKKRSKKI